jgi:hypothetical protein
VQGPPWNKEQVCKDHLQGTTFLGAQNIYVHVDMRELYVLTRTTCTRTMRPRNKMAGKQHPFTENFNVQGAYTKGTRIQGENVKGTGEQGTSVISPESPIFSSHVRLFLLNPNS